MKALMIQGTASNVGKTLFVIGLCRLLATKGFKVCPFKAQNITTYSYHTVNNQELGYAQHIQALACNIISDSRMNPVLIKVRERHTDFFINGRLNRQGDFKEYAEVLSEMKSAIIESYKSLCQEYDFIIIEGAGSPAEINQSEDDIANMWFADHFQIPVLLMSNMEYGGSFASIVGTLELLAPQYRNLIKGFILNKYDGELSTLYNGTRYIENIYRIPFLGAIPYIENLTIQEEDKLFRSNSSDPNNFPDINNNLFHSFDRLADVIKKHIHLSILKD